MMIIQKATFGSIICHGVDNPWTRADGRKKQSLKLVSRQFRKQRNVPAAGPIRPSPNAFIGCSWVNHGKPWKLTAGNSKV